MQNVILLFKRDRTLIIEALNTKQNDETRLFTQKDGFQMAIALIDYSGIYSDSEPEEFMDIKVV